MSVIKQIFWISIITFMFMGLYACNQGSGSNAASATTATDFSLEGYETSDFGNGILEVVKKDPSGNLIEYGTLKNGKQHGSWVFYGNKRKPIKIISYVDGLAQGQAIEMTVAGQIESIYFYKNNELHGDFKKYNYSFLNMQANYKNGKLDGQLIEYYDQTKVVRQESNYKNGKLDGISKYFDLDGNLTFEQMYKNGEKTN